jgi:WD40 repeat protein
MYSPSGAGKTSLIEAKLLPRVEAEGLVALPTVRVGLPLDASRPLPATANRYVTSALSTLGAQESEDTLSLNDFLDQRTTNDADPQLLVLDQFEEVLVEDPTDRKAKEEFFRQLGLALRARDRWALIAMREDYVAGLDPYLRFIPTRLTARFRLDLLDERAAIAAIVGPAQLAGVNFEPIAKQLVNDLRLMRVQRPDGTFEQQLGPYVEPVQLQVVCLRLWESLPPGTTSVENLDLTWNVDQALADYYGDRVHAIAESSGVPERQIREWVGQHLITPLGLRGQVLQQPAQTEGLPNSVIQDLEDAHLVRGERRRGATWFELAHDRLIDPVRGDNKRWLDTRLTSAQRRAQLWSGTDRSEALLLRGAELKEAERWLQAHPQDAAPIDAEFLTASRRVESQRAARQRLLLARGVIALGTVAILLLGAYLWEQYQADQRLRDVNRSVQIANHALQLREADPEKSLLLATDAVRTPDVPVAEDALRAALVASHIRRRQDINAGPEYVAAFSNNGKLVLAAGQDGKVRLWRADAGLDSAPIELVRPPTRGRLSPLTTATFSPDADRVAAGGLEQPIVWVWDVASPASPLALMGHTGAILSVDYSPDGRHIVTASDDKTARVWDATSGAPELVLQRHTDAVSSAVYTPDGSQIVTTSYDGTTIVWNADTGTPVRALPTQSARVYDVAFDPTGTRIVTASEDSLVRVWDPSTGALMAELRGHTSPARTARFSPDGRLIVTASDDGTARVWDATNYLQLTLLRGEPPEAYVREAAALPSLSASVDLRSQVFDATFDPTSTMVLTASADGMLREWTAIDSPVTDTFATGNQSPIYRVAYSPDGRRLLEAGGDNVVRVWDTVSRNLVMELTGHTRPVLGADISADGQHIVSAGADGTARVWDATQSPAPEPITLNVSALPVTSAVFSPDGQRIVTASSDKTARVWVRDGATFALQLVLEGHSNGLSGAVFSADGSHIVTSSLDRTARVWDANVRQPPVTLIGHADKVTAALFSADRNRVVTSSTDGTARVWDAHSGQPLAVLRQGTQALNGVGLGGRWITTAGVDGSIGIWDSVSFASIMTLRPGGGATYSAAYNPMDTHQLAVGTSDGRVLVFRCDVCAPVSELRELATQRVTRALTPLERTEFEPEP